MMQNSGVVTLLHLSDLHFGRHHRFASDDGPNSLLERLRVDLDGLREKEGLRPDLVVVSGDLAELGKKAEFEQAMRFLQRLVQTIELPTSRVVIVPGNHDINWHLCKSYFEECAANDELPVRPYFKKLDWFHAAFNKFYAGTKGITFAKDEPWSFFEYPELGVVVAGLNSVIAESHEQHFGFLGEEQLRSFAAKLRPYKERGFLRVGVTHHNPRDQRGGEETKRDQDQLKRLLAPSLNLLLHGDFHEETEDALRVNMPVFGVGSLGSAIEQRPEEVPNEYQLVQIRADGLRRYLRVYASDQDRFLASTRAVVDIPVAFERVEALGQAQGPKRATDLEELVEQYRRAIVENQRMQTVGDLLGRDALGAEMTAMDFLKLFVPQDVIREEPVRHSKRERMWALRGEDAPEAARDAPNEGFDQLEAMHPFPMGGYSDTVAGALASAWVYLLGAPGAGKTAVTRWILLSLCVPGEHIEGFSEDLIPVRIDMRLFQLAYEKAGGTFSFFDYLDRVHAERFWNLRGEPLRELARQGRLYFLFDGLDEIIDESKRRTCAELIADLARSEEYARCRGIVTSRVVGAEVAQALFDGSGFLTYALRDFTERQQDRFLDAWHGLVFAHEPEMRAHRRTRLGRALEASQSLRALCGNPLCCSLLAYLNRDEELPEGRHHLYQKILERLAEHWDANKDLPIRSASLKFELPDKLSFLRRLAWHMMEVGGAEAGNAIAQEKLVAFAQSFCEEQWTEAPDAARRRAEGLIGSLRERNEVLAWLGGDVYGFTHRALLEYSAAARAVEMYGRRSGVSELAQWFHQHWREESWEETLLLTCGPRWWCRCCKKCRVGTGRRFTGI
jgi:3',5'-cyclic AMP phosphodiesterase CpdA